MNRIGPILLLTVTVAACAPALREPPSLAELSGGNGAHTGASYDRALADAALLWMERTPDSVRQASLAFLRIAESNPDRIEPLREAVRAEVWLADRAPDEASRREAAVRAVQAAQWCGRRSPDDPACDYWLAVALGVQARERRATGLDALPRIVELLERAAEAAPRIEHAGPHRVLALVLLRAPGWPRGPGDPDLALEYARSAVEIDPGYPPNRLCLAEALRETEDLAGSVNAYREAESAARRSADPDATRWVDTAAEGLASLLADTTD